MGCSCTSNGIEDKCISALLFKSRKFIFKKGYYTRAPFLKMLLKTPVLENKIFTIFLFMKVISSMSTCSIPQQILHRFL